MAKFDKKNKNAYLRGYDKLDVDEPRRFYFHKSGNVDDSNKEYITLKAETIDDKLILSDRLNKSDWEIDGVKNTYDYSKDRSNLGTMYTDTENTFRYSLDLNTEYEDPTYLIFNVYFDTDASPLWNYGSYSDGQIERIRENSPTSFITKYGNITEIANRGKIYIEFLKGLDKIFNKVISENENDKKFKKSYYIESINGLENFNKKMINYGTDKISITLSEDISLKSSYLAELYNNLTYSYKNQRYLIPDNLLRFDMVIEITDLRIFRVIEKDENGELISKINNNPPRIIYTLHDCNFDFFNSMPFLGNMDVAGFNKTNNSQASLKFDIKYKSISKEFRSELIQGSISLHNKLDKLVDNDIVTKTNILNSFIINDEKIQEKKEKENFTHSKNLVPIKNIIDNNTKTVGDKLKDDLTTNIDEYKNKLINKYDSIRGELINDVLSELRQRVPIELPKIYPDNVYSTDFRSISLDSFAHSLSTDLANTIEDTLRNKADDLSKLNI